MLFVLSQRYVLIEVPGYPGVRQSLVYSVSVRYAFSEKVFDEGLCHRTYVEVVEILSQYFVYRFFGYAMNV